MSNQCQYRVTQLKYTGTAEQRRGSLGSKQSAHVPHLVKHPYEVEAHDTLVVTNHLHGINLGAVQVLPSKLQPARLVPCA